ncbi:peroxisomal targeting signal 2 receptor-like [Sycon ciliatum]|uniref:peroxisomal targeting signal 2 receptor-like n=1 Tax=Sycon ciliatum TaxID=27933 RepID=UPI0031F64F2D
MRSFITPLCHGYDVKFSPFARDLLACVGGQHYGISGQGSLFVLQLTDEGLKLFNRGEWCDTLFSIAWSENNERLLVCGSGDGSIQLWDTAVGAANPDVAMVPHLTLKEHSLEVSDVCWACPRGGPQQLLSASWDSSVKLWDVEAAKGSLRTFRSHAGPIYCAKWCPHAPGLFASVAADGTAALCDVRSAATGVQNVFPCHQAEALSFDWNKYAPHLLATASVDGSVRGWDTRHPAQPVFVLQGHAMAVRRVCCSPHAGDRYATASYDCTVRAWSSSAASTAASGGALGIGHSSCLQQLHHHTEFVYGLDCSLHEPGLVADCSWDSTIKVYHLPALVAT